MKKTTYILFGALILIIVASFFIPAFIFIGNDQQPKKNNMLIACSGKTSTLRAPVSDITTIVLSDYSYTLFDFDRYDQCLLFNIVGTDSISEVTLKVDSSWEPIIEMTANDGILYIDFKKEYIDGKQVCYAVPTNNLTVGTILVPNNKINNIDFNSCDVTYIKNYHSKVLKINQVESTDIINCQIDSLAINHPVMQ